MSDVKLELSSADGQRFAILFEGRNFVVAEWHVPGPDAKGAPGWRPLKAPYYGSFASACRRFMQIPFEAETFESLTHVVERLEEWCQRVEAAARGEAFEGVKPTHAPGLAREQARWVPTPGPVTTGIAAPVAERAVTSQNGGGWTPPADLPPPPWLKEG